MDSLEFKINDFRFSTDKRTDISCIFTQKFTQPHILYNYFYLEFMG